VNGHPGAGSRLADRYELVHPIASGGMAQVWQATDTVLGRPVAVKLLHSHLATDRAFVSRFRREARAAARLSHPSIVSIYDTVSAEGVEAIVMELITGTTLRAMLDRSTVLDPARVVDIGIQVADGLEEAHRSGIVHRDIKPSNILLCPDQRVMVTDFGIAKAGEDTDLTVTGTLLGTAKYLSPEQVRGDDVDPRSDLYSLGVVLFEALTGRPPFKAETDAATALARLRHEAPRIRHIDPGLPQGLDDIVHRLLALDPADRFERAIDVRATLSGVDLEPTRVDATLVVATPTAALPHLDEDGRTNDEHEGDDFESFLRSERSWIVPALVLGLVAGSLLVAGLLLSRSPIAGSVLPSIDRASESGLGNNDDPTTDETTDDVVGTDTTTLTDFVEVGEPRVVAVRAVDPDGDGTERNETADLAVDGDQSSFWRTESYTGPRFAGLPKRGVGLVFDLGGMAAVEEVTLSTNSTGWAVELYLGESFTGGPDTWGAPIVSGTNLADAQTFDLGGATGALLLVWVTDHGTSPDGDDEGDEPDHRFELNEISIS
jgi:serine/threonine-protein kinase